jgi:acetyl-CoA C-acetyltransferase
MKAIMLAAQNIALGGADTMVAGGMESMTNVPYYSMSARFNGLRYGHGQLLDGLLHDGLWDPYGNHHMGIAAEKCAVDYNLSREEQDNFAIESYRRSALAWENGYFDKEIVPVTISTKKGDKVISVDEEFTNVNLDRIPTLKPAFKKDGTVTAANASTINDGASALVLMAEEKAAELGLKPLARIRGFADAAREPVDFTTAPALALPKVFRAAGVERSDVDLFEINEAFSVVCLANMKLLDIAHSDINVNGGGVSLGHPIGSSGSRIVATLIHLLHRTDKTIGAAGICNGGGGAGAIVVERI